MGNQFIENEQKMLNRKELEHIESKLYYILKKFYDLYHKTEYKQIATIHRWDLVKELVGEKIMDLKDVNHAIDYLKGERLLESPSPNIFRISHRGIKKIQASIKYPELSTEYSQPKMIHITTEKLSMNNNITNDLRGANIANFANQLEGNAQQVASNFSQNINQNMDEITKLIDSLRNMAREFPEEYEEQREEELAHLEDLQEEIATPEKRKPSRIKAGIIALLGTASIVASHVAGGTDFLNTTLDLFNKLGVPIDINIPQLIQNLSK